MIHTLGLNGQKWGYVEEQGYDDKGNKISVRKCLENLQKHVIETINRQDSTESYLKGNNNDISKTL